MRRSLMLFSALLIAGVVIVALGMLVFGGGNLLGGLGPLGVLIGCVGLVGLLVAPLAGILRERRKRSRG